MGMKPFKECSSNTWETKIWTFRIWTEENENQWITDLSLDPIMRILLVLRKYKSEDILIFVG